MYIGDLFFHPDIPFDNGLDQFDGSELEKSPAISDYEAKNKIISKLTEIFGGTTNVKMTFTKKGQQKLLVRSPVVNCNVQEHELKQHLLRKKQMD